MEQPGVDITRIAQLLLDSAAREEQQLTKIAQLEEQVVSLTATRDASKQVQFEHNQDDFYKQASELESVQEMGVVANDMSPSEYENGRARLNTWLETL
jgi:DNA-binding protein H-NS